MLRRKYLAFVCVMLLSAKSLALESKFGEAESYPQFWKLKAQETLRASLKRLTVNNNPAKNVIIMIGDGMDIATMTAGRIMKGQRAGFSGEETSTSIDKFPFVGLSKVYTINSQTPDSAGTATAIMTGSKAKSRMLGLNGKTQYENCKSAEGNEMKTILEEFAEMGRSTGVVTTAHVAHATPASAYAHTPSRGWVSDSDLPPEALQNGCKDVAAQLIDQGRKLNVILGGGRVFMRPKGYEDEEYGVPERKKMWNAGRNDGRNLIEEWQALAPAQNARYVWDLDGFESIRARDTDYLLGLFEPDDMRYEHERENDTAGEPSLAEMTHKAIQILRKNENGYFLLVEGGKIDHGHHETRANVALNEFIGFDAAVQMAASMTDESETLIVVTADHGHMFTHGGYSVRGNPVNGLAEDHNQPAKARDGLAYTNIAYGNGAEWLGDGSNRRRSLEFGETEKVSFRFPSAIPLTAETHSSTDVAVLARGPMSHLFGGVYEQNYIGYAMMYASCTGDDRRHCRTRKRYKTFECPKASGKASIIKKSFMFDATFSRTGKANPGNELPWWCYEDPRNEWVPPTTTASRTMGDPEDNTMYYKASLTTTANQRIIKKVTIPDKTTRVPRRGPIRPTRILPTEESYDPRIPAGSNSIPRRPVRKTIPRTRTSPTTTPIWRKRATTSATKKKPRKGRTQSPVTRSKQPGKWRTRQNLPTTAPKWRKRATTATTQKKQNNAQSKRPRQRGTQQPRRASNLNQRTKPKKNKRGPRPTTHRVFRREITTESFSTAEIQEGESSSKTNQFDKNSEEDTISTSPTEQTPPKRQAVDNQSPSEPEEESDILEASVTPEVIRSSTDLPERSTKHPKERFLDQIALAIRNELRAISVYSNEMSPASLDLSIKVAPVVKNTNGDEDNSETSELSSERNQTDPLVVCMQWSSDSGMVGLGSNSSKIAFLYSTEEGTFEKQQSKNVATGGSSSGTVVLLAILTVSFLIISVILLYLLWKRNAMLNEEIEGRERDKKLAVLSRMRLQDIEQGDLVYGEIPPNVNNNSIVATGQKRSSVGSVSQWCSDAYETKSIRKSRKISEIPP